jgi:hypothetical protein
MDNFYKKYKKLREDQKIDLTDIENRTKINIKYLKALEAGNFYLIQEPYTKLFLRAYINEIGADPDVAISELSEYLLKLDSSKSKETGKAEWANRALDKIPKDNSVSSKKKSKNFQDIPLKLEKNIVKRRTTITANLIKGILFFTLWVIIIIVIRNITLDNKNEIPIAKTNQLIENITRFTNFQQIQADFLEVSSLQTAIEESIPFVIKIVSKNTLGIVSVQDSLEVKSFLIASGDQKTYSLNANLDILLNHSEGVTVFINGEAIQDIRSQQTPVRLIFSVEPISVTIKHYSRVY